MSAALQYPQRIRLMIVDDHSVVLHGLRALFSSRGDVEIVGEASTRDEAIALGRATRCDVALVDMRLRDTSGLDVIRALAVCCPQTRAIVLTNYGAEHDVGAAMLAGARGYVLKHAEPSEIVDAVRTVGAGRRYFSPEAAAILGSYVSASPLTDREQQVLELLVPGTRNRDIGRILGVAEETVKKHVRNIFSKLDAKDRTEAAMKAIKRGLVKVE
jgi:two-component system, NarL family, response regulator